MQTPSLLECCSVLDYPRRLWETIDQSSGKVKGQVSERSASEDFRLFLDSVCTPVNTSEPIVNPERDYAWEKHNKQERYRHNYLMENSFWYRQEVLESQRLEGLRLKAKAKGEEFKEPAQKELGEDGFWTQF